MREEGIVGVHGCIWVYMGVYEGVWRVFGGCLEGVWRVFGGLFITLQ